MAALPPTKSSAAEHQPAGPLGGDVEHDQEQAEEQQAGAEVLLEDQDPEADQPHDQDRAEVAAARQVDEQHPSSGEGEGVAVKDEVARERDHQQHLGDLAGLEAERADADPDPRAVHGLADARRHRQEQQHDRRQARGVGEPGEDAVVAQQDQRRDEQDDAEGHPDELLLRVVVLAPDVLVGQVEPVDHGEAEAVERRDRREQDRVGVRRDQPDRDVGADDQDGQATAVADDVRRHLALDADADRGVRADADGEGEDEQEQLGAPAAPVHEAHDEPGSAPSAGVPSGDIFSARLSTVLRASSGCPRRCPRGRCRPRSRRGGRG